MPVASKRCSRPGAVYRQLDLLGTDDTQQEKQEAVESAMDALRKKFGRGVISYGTAEDNISGEKIERD